MTSRGTYLLQLVHQGRRELERLLVGIVKLFCEDLVDNPVLACENDAEKL